MKKNLRQERWCENSVPMSLRPIRLTQLVFDIMLLFLSISLWMELKERHGTGIPVILTILFASFSILLSVEAIGQIGGCRTPNLPMLLISLAGLILFTSAAQIIYLLVYQKDEKGKVGLLALIALCVVAALLFLLDSVIIIMHWRYNCTKIGKCIQFIPSGRSGPSEPLQPIEYADVSTSVSFDNRRSSDGSNNRRQYVDRSTRPEPNKSNVKIVETQTQRVKSAEYVDHESSAIAVVKEKKAQTLSPCPVCASALDYSPEGICPSFLALVQNFGMFSCASSPQQQVQKPEPAILVDRGTMPGSNSSKKLKGGLDSKESTLVITKRQPRVYETRPCPTHGAGLLAQRAGLPSPITRISVTHSIRKNKRSQTPSSKPVVITEKHQNTEINVAVETTNIQCSRSCQSTRGKQSTSTQNVKEPVKIGEIDYAMENDDKNGEKFSSEKLEEESFIAKESIEKVETVEGTRESEKKRSIISDDLSEIEESSESKITQERKSEESKEEEEELSSSSPRLESSFERKKDRTETHEGKDVSLLQQNIIVQKNNYKIYSNTFSNETASTDSQASSTFAQITINESTTFANSALTQCQCSEYYYYKDVFGRYICGLCAHKYLIKIPQRSAIKPIENMRCCSCSQVIFHRSSNAAGQICRCRRCCNRCKCQPYTHKHQ